MALVSIGFKLTVTLSDQGGNKSTLKFDLVAVDAETAAADAEDIVAALDAITTAAIIGYNVGEQFSEDTVEFGTGEVESVALIVARIEADEKKYANIRVPAPVVGIFKAAAGDDYNEVDAADTDLVAYLNLFADSTGVALLSDGETLRSPGTAGNVTGKRIHRASKKG